MTLAAGNPFGKNSNKDNEGNALKGKVIIEQTKNCYLRSEDRLIVGIDLNNLVVIETNDVILVANKESTQKVKNIVEDLKKEILLKVLKIKKLPSMGKFYKY